MSVRALDLLVGEAVCNAGFCAALLNGHREEIIGAYDLSPKEKAFVLSIQAATLQEFAQALHGWLEDDQPPRGARLPWENDLAAAFAPRLAAG